MVPQSEVASSTCSPILVNRSSATSVRAELVGWSAGLSTTVRAPALASGTLVRVLPSGWPEAFPASGEPGVNGPDTRFQRDGSLLMAPMKSAWLTASSTARRTAGSLNGSVR